MAVMTAASLVWSQDRWPEMPGYAEYQEAQRAARELPRMTFSARWTGKTTVQYALNGENLTFDAATGRVSRAEGLLEALPEPVPQQQPARGRQFTEVKSPDDAHRAFYEDGNVFLETDGDVKAVTTEGDLDKRIKYGTASWVYGEELSQRHAMGFSPDSKKLWFYRFDDSPLQDYYVTLGHRDQQTTLYPEAYPKPGKDNPIVDLYVYDIPSGKTTKVKVRPGEFNNGLGHYVYAIAWGEDSSELYFYRMDRRQKIRELVGANPADGSIRVIDRDENQAGWVEAGPLNPEPAQRSRSANPDPIPAKMLVLDENTGWMNLYWLDTKAGKRQTVTNHKFDIMRVLAVDEANERIFYMAGDGDTHYRHQLHVVNFDGSGENRLTDPKYHHSVQMNEDMTLLTVESQNSETVPMLSVMDVSGKVVKELGQIEVEDSKGFRPEMWYVAQSFDGATDLHCSIDFPRNFDPSKKYPVLVSVYGGPGGAGAGPSESFSFSSPQASTGFLIVKIRGRAENGRGRAFRQGIYRKMGIIEIDDQAAGVKALAQFPWADTSRVGIYGTSYGGYSSAMALVRYPDLFHAASASSMVSQWTNYDTTYTERYMDLLEENEEGYKAGSVMEYADNLKGWLMLYYGTADDNTHPANTLQLCDALTRAGKFYEVQVGVDRGHSGLGFARMMEFFTERLVIDGPRN